MASVPFVMVAGTVECARCSLSLSRCNCLSATTAGALAGVKPVSESAWLGSMRSASEDDLAVSISKACGPALVMQVTAFRCRRHDPVDEAERQSQNAEAGFGLTQCEDL